MDIVNVLFRTVFFYFFIMVMYKIMGKREIAQLGIVDLIVSILTAELVAISIENKNESMLFTIIPLLALVGLELLFAFISLKSKKFRNFFEGKTTTIVKNGKINYKEMVKERYTIDDLLFELRQKGIKSLKNVEYAFLEANGRLSIFEKNTSEKGYPIPIIIDGEIDYTSLKNVRKSTVWLKYILDKNDILLEEVFYAFYRDNKLYFIKKDELLN